jgi:uncharacterized protein (TIGR02246 family)
MKLSISIATAAALAAQPLAAQGHAGHGAAPSGPVPSRPAENAEAAAVRAVLAQYHAAIERLDATGTEQLFAADSAVFETGGVEGSYRDYLGHHLGPELKEFKSFKFSDYKADVRFEGPVALATETYKYRIETKDGTIAERQGVTTSVLKKIDGNWKILVSHNSGRKPKGS